MNGNLWNLFEAVVNVYEGFNIFFFIFAFLDFNFKSQKNKIIFSCGAILHSCIIFIFNALMMYEGVWSIVYIMFSYIYTLFFLRSNPIKTIFVAILPYIWVISVNAMVTVFISSISESGITELYTTPSLERFILIISVQIIVTYALRITLKIFRKNGIRLRLQEWMLILAVFVLSYCVIMMIHIVQINQTLPVRYHNLLLLSSFGIIIINVVCYYMVVSLSKANEVKLEHKLLKTESDYRKHYAENAKTQYDEIRRIRHDMKQSYNVIYQLASKERYEELLQYLPQMNAQLSFTDSTITTNHAIVNAILNTKLSAAKKHEIRTLCNTVKELHIGQIEEIDLCHLLGNLLDNAIEAAVNCPENKTRYMEVSITEHNQMLMITVKNSFDPDKLYPAFRTSKPDKAEHGFGIRTIKQIAKKYNGFADFYQEDDLFCCNVTLEMK